MKSFVASANETVRPAQTRKSAATMMHSLCAGWTVRRLCVIQSVHSTGKSVKLKCSVLPKLWLFPVTKIALRSGKVLLSWLQRIFTDVNPKKIAQNQWLEPTQLDLVIYFVKNKLLRRFCDLCGQLTTWNQEKQFPMTVLTFKHLHSLTLYCHMICTVGHPLTAIQPEIWLNLNKIVDWFQTPGSSTVLPN